MNIEEIRQNRQKKADLKAQKLITKARTLEHKASELRQNIPSDMQFWTQPGIEHLKNRPRARLQRSIQIQIEAEGLRAQAEGIRNNVCVAGDAERARAEKRAANDQEITEGTYVYDPVYRFGKVIKVNKKTYTIDFGSGFITTRDKSFVEKRTVNFQKINCSDSSGAHSLVISLK